MKNISNKKIAILGATSHIAKGLISGFCQAERHELFLFGRSPDRIKAFLTDINSISAVQALPFSEFNNAGYDVVINCVGIGDPGKLKSEISSIFKVTETYDNLVLDYLEGHLGTLYINFSSGAAYGTDFTLPANESSFAKFDINHISSSDYYGIVKLHSEAKHRAMSDFNIVDLRVFGYFSRFIDLDTKFLISEVISCVINKKEFVTGPGNILRDYVHPEDLMSLIELCISRHDVNDVFDVYSLKPVTKFEMLDYFVERYRFKYRIEENFGAPTATGKKDNYYSSNRRSEGLGYSPRFTSLDSIMQESETILKTIRRHKK